MLVAQDVALEMVVAIKPLVDRVARHDRSLADQVRRAAQSVVLNVAEGRSSHGRNACARYFTALASANETRAGLRVALAWGYLDAPGCDACLRLLDRSAALLWGLTHRRGSVR